MSESDKLEAIPLDFFEDDDKLSNFNSQVPKLDEFIRNNARTSDKEMLTSTSIIVNEDKEVVAYFTLNSQAQEIKSLEDQASYQVPYVNLTYLAVDYRFCRQGYGKRIVNFIYQKLISSYIFLKFSFLNVEALTESVGFYQKLGFKMDEPVKKTYEYQGDRLSEYTLTISTDKIYEYLYSE